MNSLRSPVSQLVKRLAVIALVILAVVRPEDSAAASDSARVTKIVRDVKLLPEGAKAQPASLNDSVKSDTGVRTGDRSRSELTFTDLTIERLGANTLFHFKKAGRVVELESGSMLLRIPKNSGGAQMQTKAVTVGVSGTTLILETTSAGRNKLYVLEGSARLALRRHPRESVNLRGGQMEDVPAGATKLPPPMNFNVNDVMQKHPLITDFPPLPSRDLIYANAGDRPIKGQPVSGGPMIVPPVIGPILGGAGVAIGPGPIGGGTGRGTRGVRRPTNRDGTGGQTTAVNSDGSLTGYPTTGPNRTPTKQTQKRKPKGR
ncbi:MAG TPA: FecR family protein [Chthoniobacterales bacterium]|nr:FecR family protein [Chthoniobacterales bacterium]